MLAVALLAPAAATAQPPPNDSAAGAAFFQPFTAEDGTPHDLGATAELAEATADRGVKRCLGSHSFQRTVWYRIPAAPSTEDITVDASGTTLAVVDLAAFVQPQGATTPATWMPNACDGVGSGGSDATQEPTSAVTLRVPAGRDVLIQVGRRGAVGSPDEEQVFLSLDQRAVTTVPQPKGDVAAKDTPLLRWRRSIYAPLFGATTTEDDPAEPVCPSMASVWRRYVPKSSGTGLITVWGNRVSTLTAFAGSRPTPLNALDCVDRAANGAMQMRVPLKRKRPLWVRAGTDAPNQTARAEIRLADGKNAVVVNGGAGGFDPTPGGPGGGLPVQCDRVQIARARITGSGVSGFASVLNRRSTFAMRVRVSGSPACDAQLQLRGPHGRVYATGRTTLLTGRRTVTMRRARRLVAGSYRLHVTALSELATRATVKTTANGRLR